MKPAFVASIAFVCFSLAGCIPGTKERMEQKGFDAAYSQGYEDGIASGKNAAGTLGYQLKKDTRSFANDAQYRQGWTDGYDAGKTQELEWQKQIRKKAK